MRTPTRTVKALADVIHRAQQNGRRTPIGIANAIDAAWMVMSPETAAEHERVRTERDRYCIAWRMARTRALSVRGAADRAGARVREGQKALQDMVGALLGVQMERDALWGRVSELAQVEASLLRLLPTEPCPQEGTPVELAQERAWHEAWELVAGVLGVTLPYERPAAEAGKVTCGDAGGITQADFFQPGRTYTERLTGFRAPELTSIFHVEHVARHPVRGVRRAIGWARTGTPGAQWHGTFQDEHDFGAWTEAPAGEFAPPTATAPTEPAAVTVYRAEYEHAPTPLETYTTRAAARLHCWTEARQEEARERVDFDLVWEDDPDDDEVEELWIGTGPDNAERTGYLVRASVIATEYDPEASA